jgi:hypothetical protein
MGKYQLAPQEERGELNTDKCPFKNKLWNGIGNLDLNHPL